MGRIRQQKHMTVSSEIIIRPLVHALVFVEFWIRPFKNKMEKMLVAQRD